MSQSRRSYLNKLPSGLLSAQNFEELAKSRPQFDNVGAVESITKNSINPYTYTSYMQGSGVYLGKQIVITAAQCLPASFKEGVFASSMKHQTYFVSEDKDGNLHSARVIMANRYPHYKLNNTSLKNVTNNIAILVLDDEFEHLKPVSTLLTPINKVKDCIHVGYSKEKVSSLPLDGKRVPVKYYNMPTRVGVKFPSLAYKPYIKLHSVSLGFSAYANASALCGLIKYQLSHRHAYDPLESGPTPRMYGGGYFNNDSLLGIVAGTIKPRFTGAGSALPLDKVICIPLSTHKKWIEKTLIQYDKQMPTLMLQSKQWNRDYIKYESTQNNIRKFIAQNHSELGHEEQLIKKSRLDEIAQKIRELHARGDQELRTNALYKIYLAFKNLNFDSQASLQSYHYVYEENVTILKEFDKNTLRRTIGSFFTSNTSTYKLIMKLNDFIEEKSFHSEKIKYFCRYGEPCRL